MLLHRMALPTFDGDLEVRKIIINVVCGFVHIYCILLWYLVSLTQFMLHKVRWGHGRLLWYLAYNTDKELFSRKKKEKTCLYYKEPKLAIPANLIHASTACLSDTTWDDSWMSCLRSNIPWVTHSAPKVFAMLKTKLYLLIFNTNKISFHSRSENL